MGEAGCLSLIGFAVAFALFSGFVVTEANRPHESCVDARRIEQIVGKPARICPAIPSWRENWSHTDADHG